MSGDDPHADTALAVTAGTSDGGLLRPSGPRAAPRQLGRFRLERELGRGGMGAVYAARDPELERTVAIKILRDAGGGPDTRARLLREARAMAKLAHPNVITVFEAGTADDHDYIAMELVDGETLAAWLARGRQGWRDVLRVFVAAGRGLAAAHAAGLVHRDFKPGNVLCGRDGRVVVTDFGLAVPADAVQSCDDATPDASVEDLYRTRTGLVLGTPAYMAPEQWTADAVGAASDQFAFCVALWEALAGERPFRGDSRDELRRRVLAGDAHLEARGLPRMLRSIVRRGLAADPAQRWPTMAALIAALERRLALRRRIALAASAGGFAALGLAGALMFLGRATAETANPCPGPYDPDVVWAPVRASALAARHPEAARLIATDVASWRGVRAQVCASRDPVRTAQLACLDGVMARIATVADDLEHATTSRGDGAAEVLIEPAVCARTPAPRLVAPIDPPLAAAFAALRRRVDGDRATTPHSEDACATIVAILADLAQSAKRQRDMLDPRGLLDATRQLERISPRCTDDPLRALGALALMYMPGAAGYDRAEEAVRAVPFESALGALEMARAKIAREAERWDEADQHLTAAIEHFEHRHQQHEQLGTVLERVSLLLARGTPASLRTVLALAERYRPIATPIAPEIAQVLEHDAALARWRLGDVEEADRILATNNADVVMERRMLAHAPRDVSGLVVDEAGAPVAAADVAADADLLADTAMLASPPYAHAVRATTDASGRFELHGIIGRITARHGAARGTGETRIVLHPTTTLAGHVALADPATGRIHVLVRGPDDYAGVAPIREDGSYTLANVPRGALAVEVLPTTVLVHSAPSRVTAPGEHTALDLVARRFRRLHIIARTRDIQAPEFAALWVLPHAEPTLHTLTIGELDRYADTATTATAVATWRPPDATASLARPDDLFATIDDRRPGPLTLCATAFNFEHVLALGDDPNRVRALPLACTTIDAATDVAVVELPAVRRPD